MKGKIEKQTRAAAQEICEARFAAWNTAPATQPGAQQAMDLVLRRMIEEISEQVRDIQGRYDRVQMQLTGLTPTELGQAGGTGGEWGKRILAGAFGLIMPDYGISYMNEGFKGLGRTALIHLGVGAVVGMMGGPVTVAIGAAIAAGTVYTAITAPEKIKALVAKQVVDGLTNGTPATKDQPAQPGLRELADRTTPHLREKVGEFFDQLEVSLRKAVALEVESEEAAVKEQLANASKGAKEKELLLSKFGEFRQCIADNRAGLEQAIDQVRQGRA